MPWHGTHRHQSCRDIVLTDTDMPWHGTHRHRSCRDRVLTDTDHALTLYSQTPIMPWHSTHRQTPITTWHSTHKHWSCPDTVLTNTDYALTQYSQTSIMPWHTNRKHRSCPDDTVLTDKSLPRNKSPPLGTNLNMYISINVNYQRVKQIYIKRLLEQLHS